jgi:hypothetical protein
MTVDTDADKYQFSLNDATDLNLVEADTEFRAKVIYDDVNLNGTIEDAEKCMTQYTIS